MKKLMFMLAAVAMAVGAHGASVYWTCTNVKDGDGNAINGVAYFINAATLSQDAFKALSGADAFTTALSGKYSYTPTDAGKYTVTADKAVANATLGVPDATTGVSAYLAIFDTATITDSSNYYLTEVKSHTAGHFDDDNEFLFELADNLFFRRLACVALFFGEEVGEKIAG